MKTSRSDLLSLLSEACELEHGLACSYLYSAFTLKQSVYENDLTWQEFQFTRKWASQLFFIASQEMMHLAQVWNLLSAIGGTPYYYRPNYPVSHQYYPTHLPIILEPFGKSALKRFIFYELPSHVNNIDYLVREFGIPSDEIGINLTVGALYAEIERIILSMDAGALFIGDPSWQVGPDVCHFNEIVKVVDAVSAKRAIDTIIEEGEGTSNQQMNCHYGMFVNMNNEMDALIKAAVSRKAIFEPARKTILNPVTQCQMDQSPVGATLIKDEFANSVAVLFDSIYSLMVRTLQYVFQSGPLGGKQPFLGDLAIQIMARVIKPLGESLTMILSGSGVAFAGPAFGLYRHVSLPDDPAIAITLIKERMTELVEQGKILATDDRGNQALKDGVEKLEEITSSFVSKFIH